MTNTHTNKKPAGQGGFQGLDSNQDKLTKQGDYSMSAVINATAAINNQAVSIIQYKGVPVVTSEMLATSTAPILITSNKILHAMLTNLLMESTSSSWKVLNFVTLKTW